MRAHQSFEKILTIWNIKSGILKIHAPHPINPYNNSCHKSTILPNKVEKFVILSVDVPRNRKLKNIKEDLNPENNMIRN